MSDFKRLRTCSILLCLTSFFVGMKDSARGQSVTLAWDVSADPVVIGYNVYRSEQSQVYLPQPVNGGTLVTSPSFTDSTVQYNRTYYYSVTAVGSSGEESAHSDEIQVIIGSPGAAGGGVGASQPAPVSSGLVEVEPGTSEKKSGLGVVGYRYRGGVVYSADVGSEM